MNLIINNINIYQKHNNLQIKIIQKEKEILSNIFWNIPIKNNLIISLPIEKNDFQIFFLMVINDNHKEVIVTSNHSENIIQKIKFPYFFQAEYQFNEEEINIYLKNNSLLLPDINQINLFQKELTLQHTNKITNLLIKFFHKNNKPPFKFGIFGPNGCGKSSIYKSLINNLPNNYLVIPFEPWLYGETIEELYLGLFNNMENKIIEKHPRINIDRLKYHFNKNITKKNLIFFLFSLLLFGFLGYIFKEYFNLLISLPIITILFQFGKNYFKYYYKNLNNLIENYQKRNFNISKLNYLITNDINDYFLPFIQLYQIQFILLIDDLDKLSPNTICNLFKLNQYLKLPIYTIYFGETNQISKKLQLILNSQKINSFTFLENEIDLSINLNNYFEIDNFLQIYIQNNNFINNNFINNNLNNNLKNNKNIDYHKILLKIQSNKDINQKITQLEEIKKDLPKELIPLFTQINNQLLENINQNNLIEWLDNLSYNDIENINYLNKIIIGNTNLNKLQKIIQTFKINLIHLPNNLKNYRHHILIINFLTSYWKFQFHYLLLFLIKKISNQNNINDLINNTNNQLNLFIPELKKEYLKININNNKEIYLLYLNDLPQHEFYLIFQKLDLSLTEFYLLIHHLINIDWSLIEEIYLNIIN